MTRRVDPTFTDRDSLIFLAIWEGAGEFCDLPDVIFRFDALNKDIPSAEELDGGLNRLIAAGLVIARRGGFGISVKALRDFEAYRKRRRRGRLAMAERFIGERARESVPRRVSISASLHRQAYAEYRRRFAEWVRHAKLPKADRAAILEGMRV
jgi:hypothetical protein